jgi:hypothetical protein
VLNWIERGRFRNRIIRSRTIYVSGSTESLQVNRKLHLSNTEFRCTAALGSHRPKRSWATFLIKLTPIANQTRFKNAFPWDLRIGHNAGMKKAIPSLLNVRIRPIEPGDFNFIRSLAAEFPTFTIPSEYLLWFLSHFHPEYCRILEQESGGSKAYLLALPTTNPRNGIAIWQVAASEPNRPFALEYFAAYLRDLVERTGATSVFFTMPKASASLRLIRSLARKFGGCEVIQLASVPSEQGEYEFRLSIETVSSARRKPRSTSAVRDLPLNS